VAPAPDVPALFAALITLGVLLIAVLLWTGVERALRTLALPAPERARLRVGAAAILGGWLLLAFWLGAAGAFRGRSTETLPAAAFGIVVPVAIGLALVARSRGARDVVAATPQHLLIGVQLYRIIGGVFLLLMAQGSVPGAFAVPAGVGDLLVGLTAPAVALLYRRDAVRWRGAALLWNLFGLADLIVAVTLGVLTAPGRLQQLALDAPNALIASFPLVLIPVVLVPVSILLHLLSLRQLRRQSRTAA
jgi:hypothetical protein